MIALNQLAVVGLVIVAIGLGVVGCQDRTGGMVEETREYSFDEIAAAAAAESEVSEDTAE